jgi:hypothetical protein
MTSRNRSSAPRHPCRSGFWRPCSQIGDAACLDAIAAAAVQSSPESGPADWWRQHLARLAFHTIVKREGLTRRHGVIRKIAKRWGDAARVATTCS